VPLPRRAKKLFFAVVLIAGALGLLELGARAARARFPCWFTIQRETIGEFKPVELRQDDRLLWRLQTKAYTLASTSYRVNSLGFRGPPLQTPKPEGTFRILFLGDSSVYGQDVKEELTFPALTATLLSRRTKRVVETVNAAVPGYSSTQCRLLLEDRIALVQPDLVVIAALWSDSMPNDWSDDELFRRFSTLAHRFAVTARTGLRRSALYSLLETFIESSRPIPADRKIFWQRVLSGNTARTKQRVSVPQHEQNLRSMCAASRQRGARCAFLILPDENDLLEDPMPHVMGYRENYRRLAKELGVVLVDAGRAFRKFADSEADEYFLDGLHPNQKGHKIIAAKLAEALMRHEYLR